MNEKNSKPFDFSTFKRDPKQSVAGIADLEVDFTNTPERYANEFPDKQIVFKDAQILDLGDRMTFSATYLPDQASYWEFMINTPKSPGFYRIGVPGGAYVGLRQAGNESHMFNYDTVELRAYTPDNVYDVRLVNAGQNDSDGFKLVLASNVPER